MVLEGGSQGWQAQPLMGTSPSIWTTLLADAGGYSGSVVRRLLISFGLETGRATQSHCWLPLSWEVLPAPAGRGSPTTLVSPFFASWKLRR